MFKMQLIATVRCIKSGLTQLESHVYRNTIVYRVNSLTDVYHINLTLLKSYKIQQEQLHG